MALGDKIEQARELSNWLRDVESAALSVNRTFAGVRSSTGGTINDPRFGRAPRAAGNATVQGGSIVDVDSLVGAFRRMLDEEMRSDASKRAVGLI